MSSKTNAHKRWSEQLLRLETSANETAALLSQLRKQVTVLPGVEFLHVGMLMGAMSAFRASATRWLELERPQKKKNEDSGPSASPKTSSEVTTVTSPAPLIPSTAESSATRKASLYDVPTDDNLAIANNEGWAL